MFIHSLLVMLMLVSWGCGADKKAAKKTSAQNTLISKSGMQTVSASSEYVGVWTGFIESTPVDINIKADGSVTFTYSGKTENEKMVKDVQNKLFITDTQNQQLIAVFSNGMMLSISLPSDEEGEADIQFDFNRK